ncbi:MAG: LamG-like jellyroll fold domain-containing protein [Verrucomicrobiota bacterium]
MKSPHEKIVLWLALAVLATVLGYVVGTRYGGEAEGVVEMGEFVTGEEARDGFEGSGDEGDESSDIAIEVSGVVLSGWDGKAGVLSAFDEWAERYGRAGSDAVRAALVAEGVGLAEERRAVMRELIVADPERALSVAVPYGMRARLPAAVVAELEEPISAGGDFEVLVTCGLEAGQVSRTDHFAVIESGARRLRAFPFGKRLDVTTKEGISLHGIAVDELMALADDPVRVVPGDELSGRGVVLGSGEIGVEVRGALYAASGDAVVAGLRERLWGDEFTLGPRATASYGALSAGDVAGLRLVEAAPGEEGVSEDEGGGGEPPVVQSPHTEGAKTMLYIRARFSDQDPAFEPITLATLQPRQTACEEYWFENSYGKSSLTTTITDTVTLSNDAATSSSGGLGSLLADARAAALAAQPAGQDWDYTNYDFYTVVTQGGSFGYGGVAFVGGSGSHLNGAGATQIRTASHEFGHNLGLRHANYWRTDSPSPIGRDSVPGGYQNDNVNDERIEYGHKFSVMSAQGGSGDFNSGRGHYTNGEKVKLDWLVEGDGDMVSVTSSTATPIRLYRHDVPAAHFPGTGDGTMTTGVARAIKINLDSDDYVSATNKRRYWLNYRRLPTNGIAETWLRRGLQVDWQRNTYGSDGSIQLDMTPFTRDSTNFEGNWTVDNNGKEDAVIVIGRTYTDEAADIHITPVAQGGSNPNEWIDVLVNVGTAAGNTAPVISSYTADATQVGTGVAVNFTAAATDGDGDTVYYSWRFGDNSMVVGSLNSTTATKSWGSAGYYPVQVTASDGKGGTDTREIIVQVGGTPADAYSISGRVLHGGMPVSGARVNIGSSYQTWTEGDGTYELAGLPTGDHTVTAAKHGLTFTPQFVNPVTLTTLGAYGKDFHANEGLGGSGGLTLAVSPFEVLVPLGLTFGFTVDGWDLAGNPVAVSPTWSVSGGGAIDGSGNFTATTLGTHTVTATASGGSATATVTVADVEAVSVTATDAAASEPTLDGGMFRVSRSSTTGNLTVQLGVSGTATGGSDYTALPGSVEILNGTNFTDVPVTVLDDFVVEGDETVVLSALPDAAYVIFEPSGTVTISDGGDVAPTVTIIEPAKSGVLLPPGVGLYLEGQATDDGQPQAISASWSVGDGPVGGSVIFSPPGALATVAQFSAAGVYELRLTASDGANSATEDITVVAGVVPQTNPSSADEDVYYTFNEGMGATATDSAGGDENGTLANGATWTAANVGIEGAALSLDGVNDQVNIADSAAINTGTEAKRTISFWFKAGDPSKAAKQVLYEEGGQTRGLNFYLQSGVLYVGGWNGGTNGWDETYLSTPLADTGWHQVALVLDAPVGDNAPDAFAAYLDGVEFGRGEGAEMTSHSGDIAIGAMRGASKFHDGGVGGTDFRFEGLIDEFHLWNRALSAFEVAQLAGWGDVAPDINVDSVDVAAGSVVIPSGVGLILDGMVTDDGAVTSLWEQVAGPGGGVTIEDASVASTAAIFSAGGFYTLRLLADDGVQKTAVDVNVHAGIASATNPTTANQVIYYALDEGTGTTAGDAVGGNNNGTLTNGVGWTATGGGVTGQAVVFDGTDDVIAIANSSSINTGGPFNERTIALWFKAATATPGGTGKEVLFEEGGGTRGLNIYLDGGNLYVGGWNNGENGWAETYHSAPVSGNQWHHVVLVLDVPTGGALQADGFRAYLNGAMFGSGQAAELNAHSGAIGLGGMQNASKYHDGNGSNDGNYFAGEIDEFHLWNGRVLSVDEIGLLYGHGNVGAMVNAGADQASAPSRRAVLAGSSSDDGRWAGTLTHEWTVASGTGTAVFSDPDAEGIDRFVEASVAGSYVFRLSADDGQVTTFDDVAVTFTGVPYYDLWAGGFPGFTGSDALAGGNADGDDRTNLEEYADGGNPTVAGDGTGEYPQVVTVEDEGQSYFEVTYLRRRDAAVRGLSYEVERCDDLAAAVWLTSGVTEVDVTEVDAEFEAVTVRLDDPMIPNGGPEFLRVKVVVDE